MGSATELKQQTRNDDKSKCYFETKRWLIAFVKSVGITLSLKGKIAIIKTTSCISPPKIIWMLMEARNLRELLFILPKQALAQTRRPCVTWSMCHRCIVNALTALHRWNRTKQLACYQVHQWTRLRSSWPLDSQGCATPLSSCAPSLSRVYSARGRSTLHKQHWTAARQQRCLPRFHSKC